MDDKVWEEVQKAIHSDAKNDDPQDHLPEEINTSSDSKQDLKLDSHHENHSDPPDLKKQANVMYDDVVGMVYDDDDYFVSYEESKE